MKAKKRRELTETRAIFTINSTREPNLVDKCMQLHQHQQGSLIAARFSGKMCPDYKYILKMHPPFSTSLLSISSSTLTKEEDGLIRSFTNVNQFSSQRLQPDSITRFIRLHVKQGTNIPKNSSNTLKETYSTNWMKNTNEISNSVFHASNKLENFG